MLGLHLTQDLLPSEWIALSWVGHWYLVIKQLLVIPSFREHVKSSINLRALRDKISFPNTLLESFSPQS